MNHFRTMLALFGAGLLVASATAALDSPIAARRAVRTTDQSKITLTRAIQIAEEHTKGKALDAELYFGRAEPPMSDEQREGAPTDKPPAKEQPGQPPSVQPSGQPGQPPAQPPGAQPPSAQQPGQPPAAAQPAASDEQPSGPTLKIAVTTLVDNARLRVVTIDAGTGKIESVRSARAELRQRAEEMPPMDGYERRLRHEGRSSELQRHTQESGADEFEFEFEMMRDVTPSDTLYAGRSWDIQAGLQRRSAGAGDLGAARGVRLETERAGDIIGTNVESFDGEELGEIDDLAIEPQTGRVEYAVLSFGGVLGVGEKLVAIPWDALRTDRQVFHLDVDKQRLREAPTFNKDNWPNMASERWAMDVRTFFGRDGEYPVNGGRNGTHEVRRTTQLVGKTVKNRNNETLGDIEELVIDPARARVAYAVISYGGKLGIGENLVAVPWSALRIQGDEVTLNISQDEFKHARSFPENEWPRMSDPNWALRTHRYYGVWPYWTREPRGEREDQQEQQQWERHTQWED